jgi:uncharacterized protein (DUF58 family)
VSPVRLRKRAAGLLFGAAVVFLMGTNAQAGWLLVISAVLVGAVLAGTVLPLLGLRDLRAEIVAPDEATQGEPVLVVVRLALDARGVRWGIRLRDGHLTETDSYVDAVRSGDRVDVTTERIAARRGRHLTSHVEVRTAAPFGVAEHRRKPPCVAETLVLPSVVPLGPLPFVEPVGTAAPAIHAAPRRGHGPEYLGIREYRTGDSMRHVHWPSTARHGAVMVREFEEERTRRLLIVIDTERDDEPQVGPTALDRCCTVAASLASTAFAHGHGARLAAAAGASEVGGTAAAAGASDAAARVDLVGRTDEGDILRWLAELRATRVPLDDAVLEVPGDATRGAETVVIVAPAWTGSEAALARAVTSLGTLAPRIVAVLVEPPTDDHGLHEAGAALVAAGAEVYPWPADADLGAILGAAS